MKMTSRILAGGAAGALALGLTAPAAIAQGGHHRHHALPTVSSRPVVVDEAAGSATVTIKLRRPAAKAISLDWSTLTRGFRSYKQDFRGRARGHREPARGRGHHHGPRIGRATAGEDYTAGNGTVVIPAGATSASVTVPVLDDTAAERAEIFLVRFRASRPEAPTARRGSHHGFKGHLRGHRGHVRHSLTVPVLITDDDGATAPRA